MPRFPMPGNRPLSFQEIKDVSGEAGDLRRSSLADVENLAVPKKSIGHEERELHEVHDKV